MAGDQTADQVVDCIPLIEAATKQKELGNGAVKSKKYAEAVTAYEQGILILDKADGHPILRSEGEQMVSLKATLYSNIAQQGGRVSTGMGMGNSTMPKSLEPCGNFLGHGN
eukprot:symbB.v1.2.004215.t1/scaffold215.1/size331178/8